MKCGAQNPHTPRAGGRGCGKIRHSRMSRCISTPPDRAPCRSTAPRPTYRRPFTGRREVRGACPHDCPDTCAMRVTVAGRQGDHGCRATPTIRPPTARCAPRCRATPSAPSTPSACCSRCKRVGPKGSGRSSSVSLGRGARRHRRAPGRDRARDAPEAIVPYSYAGTMGLVQGEGMAARFFNRLGASLLDRTICSTAGGEALAADLRRQGRHARRALRREQADRHLGQQLDRVQPALLDAIAQAAKRPARRWSASIRAAPRPPRSATSTSR